MKYRKGYKYQLAEDESFTTPVKPNLRIETYFLRLETNGDLLVRRGYAWDGASGPTIDTKNSMRASLFHDALYQLMRQGHLQKSWRIIADREFERLLKVDGMWGWRRRSWVRALKKLGSSSADPKNKKKVFTAP